MSQTMCGVLELKKLLARCAKSQLFQPHLVTGPALRGPVCLLKYSTASSSAACDFKATDKGGFLYMLALCLKSFRNLDKCC